MLSALKRGTVKFWVVVLALVMSIGCATEIAAAAARLALFPVAEPGSAQDPSLYERTIVSTSPWGREELAIARTPSLEIPIEQITTATVERRQVGQTQNPQVQAALEDLKKKGVVKESAERYFALLLKLDRTAAKKLHKFTGANIGRRFDMRLGDKRLAVAMIREPVGESLMIFLSETDETRVQGLLSPIANRVSWK